MICQEFSYINCIQLFYNCFNSMINLYVMHNNNYKVLQSIQSVVKIQKGYVVKSVMLKTTVESFCVFGPVM